jgi:hypothetical protein
MVTYSAGKSSVNIFSHKMNDFARALRESIRYLTEYAEGIHLSTQRSSQNER